MEQIGSGSEVNRASEDKERSGTGGCDIDETTRKDAIEQGLSLCGDRPLLASWRRKFPLIGGRG